MEECNGDRAFFNTSYPQPTPNMSSEMHLFYDANQGTLFEISGCGQAMVLDLIYTVVLSYYGAAGVAQSWAGLTDSRLLTIMIQSTRGYTSSLLKQRSFSFKIHTGRGEQGIRALSQTRAALATRAT